MVSGRYSSIVEAEDRCGVSGGSSSSPADAVEFAKMWRVDDAAEIELLRGRHTTHRFVPHAHDTYSIAVVTRGAMTYDHRGSVYTARPGTISVIEPGEVHTGYAEDERGWSYRNFFLGAELMRRIAGSSGVGAGAPHFASSVIVDRPLARRMRRLHRRLEEAGDPLQREPEIHRVLARLVRRHSSRGPSATSEGRSRPAVELACEYLRDTLSESVSLEEVAAVAGYSPFHFLRIFRRDMGLTPHGYQLTVRIERALELLDGSLSLADTALACGFADQSHLTRRFKQVLGVTPGQYLRGR